MNIMDLGHSWPCCLSASPSGFYRGSVSSLLGLAACLISVVVAFFAGPQLASLLSANRGVTEMLATYTDAGSLVGDYSLATTQVSGMSAALIQTVLKSVSLPDSIAAILQSNLSSAAFASAGMDHGERLCILHHRRRGATVL